MQYIGVKIGGRTPIFTGKNRRQARLEMVIREDFVPQDHILRKTDKAINFSFINRICSYTVVKIMDAPQSN